MSDEVETMAYVKLREEDVPWHGLGKPIGHLMTSAEAELEAGIAWKVVQRNVAFIDEVKAMFEKLLPIFPDDGPKAVANRMLERDILFHKYQDTPNLEKFKGTGWGVYNAISDFVTHPAFIFNRPGQKERRFMALADGHEMLEKAQQLIVPSKKIQVRYRLRQKNGNGKI